RRRRQVAQRRGVIQAIRSTPRGATRDSKSAFTRVCDALCVAGTPLGGPISSRIPAFAGMNGIRFSDGGTNDGTRLSIKLLEIAVNPPLAARDAPLGGEIGG